MQQSNAALPAPDIKPYGALTIVAQVTIGGAYSINTFTGPHREDNLCLITADRDTYRLAYKVIAEGGLNGVRPDGIHAALLDSLTHELHKMQRRTDAPSQNRVEYLNRVLDVVDPPKAKSFADFKRMHGERIEQDRRERAARKQVA